jgi:hypothetical protein
MLDRRFIQLALSCIVNARHSKIHMSHWCESASHFSTASSVLRCGPTSEMVSTNAAVQYSVELSSLRTDMLDGKTCSSLLPPPVTLKWPWSGDCTIPEELGAQVGRSGSFCQRILFLLCPRIIDRPAAKVRKCI